MEVFGKREGHLRDKEHWESWRRQTEPQGRQRTRQHSLAKTKQAGSCRNEQSGHAGRDRTEEEQRARNLGGESQSSVRKNRFRQSLQIFNVQRKVSLIKINTLFFCDTEVISRPESTIYLFFCSLSQLL